MTKRERDRKLRKDRLRTILIIAILVFFIVVIYRFVFLTRTESNDPMVTGIFKEHETEKTPLTANIKINQDSSGKYYIYLPEKIGQYKVLKYYEQVTNEEEGEGSENTEGIENPIGIVDSIVSTPLDENTDDNSSNVTIENSDENSQKSVEKEIEELKSNETEKNEVQFMKKVLGETGEEEEQNTVNTSIENTINESNTIATENIIEETNIINDNKNEIVSSDIIETSTNSIANDISNTIINNSVENTVSEIKLDNTISTEEPVIDRIINYNAVLSSSSVTEYPTLYKYYLSEDEIENRSINLDVEYMKIGELYNQELENTIASAGTTIVITGYLPYGATIQANNEESLVHTYIDTDVEYSEANLLMAYDISIIDADEQEFQPKDFSQNVKVQIISDDVFDGNLDGKTVKIKHFRVENVLNEETGIEEQTVIDEAISISKKTSNSVEFITDEFSPYAIFSFNSILTDSVTIDNYTSDLNYYKGLNYTENGTGRNTSDFYVENQNLARVTLNYYGYDYSKGATPIDISFDNATWSSTPSGTHNISSDFVLNRNNLNWSATRANNNINVTISFTSTENIDTSSSWSILLDPTGYGNNFNINNTINNNNRNISFSYNTNTHILTVSGNDISTTTGWTINGNQYSISFRLYYQRNTVGYNYNTPPNNLTFNAYVNTVVNNVSKITMTVNSPDNELDKYLPWSMSFDIPNSADFDIATTRFINSDSSINVNLTGDTLTLSGNSMSDNGFTYPSSSNYRLEFYIAYLTTPTNISSLPDNFIFNAVTKVNVGYISGANDERQNLVTYIKCVPIVSGDSVSVELIDNPFMDRPAEMGFDGWTSKDDLNISFNSSFKTQTVNYPLNGSKDVTINLYPNWKNANIIFINTTSGNDNSDGKSISSAVRTIGTAYNKLSNNANYKSATNASDRELNILVLTNGNFSNIPTGKSYTLTSLYNGHDYRSATTYLNVTQAVTLNTNQELQLDFLNVRGANNYSEDIDSTTGTYGYYLCCYANNVRIGRGMKSISATETGNDTTFSQILGTGPNSFSSKNFRVVVESGKYSNIQIGPMDTITSSWWSTTHTKYDYTGQAILVAGNDFDRMKEDNSTFMIFSRISSRTGQGICTSTVSTEPVFKMLIQSGTIGVRCFDTDNDDKAYTGIYVGGHGYSDDNTNDRNDRMIIVEGGLISNIIGGLQMKTASTVKTRIYVKGGEVYNIVGGAGLSETINDRIIQVTGGDIDYCVAGGSNGYLANSDANNGQVSGNTLVYIGGNAEIGTAGAENSLYNAYAGSVFGAGLGVNTLNQSGRVNTSKIIIADEAIINNNIYGGGNFGNVGTKDGNTTVNSSDATADKDTVTTIEILGGTIKKDVYGGGNTNNENSPIKGTTEINVRGGTILGAVYGGCNSTGTVVGSTKINITGGTIGTAGEDAVFGGGRGNGTQIAQRSNVTITNTDDDVTINGDVYGGSALGSILGSTFVNIQDTNSEKEITLLSDIYGGGKGQTEGGTISAQSNRNVTVTVDGGSYPNARVFGGANISGTIGEKVHVYIGENNSTFVNEVYGGGNQSNITTATDEDYVYIYSNGTVNNVFNGGNSAGIDGNVPRALYIDGGTVLEGAYGGSNASGTLSYTDVKCYNGSTVANAYGGGKGNGTSINGNTKVSVEGASTITQNVYGGGEGTTAIVTGNSLVDVKENSVVNINVYGGGNAGPLNGSTDVNINSSTVKGNVFGGGEGQTAVVGIDTDVAVTNSSTVETNVYGGGNAGPLTGNANVEINGSIVKGNVFGGGEGSTAVVGGDTNVDIINTSTVETNIYGGGNNGPLTGDATINVNESTVNGSVFGGGKGQTAVVGGDTEVLIEDSQITNTSDSKELGNVFGGGDQGIVEGKTIVNVDNSTVKNYVYGGGNRAEVEGTTEVSVYNNSQANSVFGGGNAGEVSGQNPDNSSTVVYINNAEIEESVYGGGNEGDVTGNTIVSFTNSTAGNSIFGGGKAADVNSTQVSVINTSARNDYTAKNVYGGGDQGELNGSSQVTITNVKIEKEIYGGGNGADNQTGVTVPGRVAGNTSINMIESSASNVFGGGNGVTAVVSGNTTTIINNSSTETREGDDISGHVFGGGNNGPVVGNTVVGLTNATIAESAYAAGNGTTAIVRGNTYIYAEGTTTIGKSIFGGGNAALTGDSSIPTPETDDDHPYESSYVTAIVDIAGATIGENVYGGANSSVIQGNTVVNIGTKAIEEFYASTIGSSFIHDKTVFTKGNIDIAGTIFGGGESMDRTKQFSYDTVSVLGTININVNGENYLDSEFNFHKSIFGSGNASRATGRTKTIDIKNYGTSSNPKQAISLQRATDVIVDNSCLYLNGTTDSTALHPDGYFTLNQLGALKIKNNTVLYLRNGANKVTSFYSLVDNEDTGVEELASVEIIDKIIGENGTTYYAKNGNIYNNAGTAIEYYVSDGKIMNYTTLQEVTSIVETVNADTFEKNVDNRIYMYSGINLNISNDEDANSEFGEVNGMTFFGLFKNISNESNDVEPSGGEESAAGSEFNEGDTTIYKGMYDENYTYGQPLTWEERNYIRTYVLGLHKSPPEYAEQDILVDGFYTIFEGFNKEIPSDVSITEDNYYDFEAYSYLNYITPTPEKDAYYMWYAGPQQDVYYFNINLIATKLSTFGAKEVILAGLSYPNASISIVSIETDLAEGVELVSKNDIPNINLDTDEANSKFGLSMKSGNSGWSMVGSTDYYYNETDGAYSLGTEQYKIENSSTTPSLSFFLYHSNNISVQRELGYYTIKMRLNYKKDSFNRGYADVILDIALSTDIYTDLVYAGAITPGRQYDLFATTTTNVTTGSSFSTYFELAEPNFYNNEKIQRYYEDSYRVISTEYVLPENTTITMIDRYDRNNPKYYYYIVTAQDVLDNKSEYRFSEFKIMGSTDEYYDEKKQRENYYIDSISYEYENFIFITDFADAKFTDPVKPDGSIATNQHFRIFLRADVEDRSEILFGLLEDHIKTNVYGIYDSESTIDIDATISKHKIYLGNDVTLTVNTNYDVTLVSGSRVYDTRFFDKKLGIKLTFYYEDENHEWKTVSGAELLGLYFELDGEKYFPSADGTTRIKIAELVSNATSNIRICTENSSIESDSYRIKIESFGSADGMYYGIESSASTTVDLEIISGVYGLNSRIEAQQAVIDTTTGKVLDNTIENIGYIAPEEHKLNFTVDYMSGLNNPYITISLYRRKYDNVYDNTYEKVDLQDYVVETLEIPFESDRTLYSSQDDADFLDSVKQFEYEYKAFDTETIEEAVEDEEVEVSFTDLELTLKNNLRTGTYKVEFTLYDSYDDIATNIITDEHDNNTAVNYDVKRYEYIGETYTYIIIK